MSRKQTLLAASILSLALVIVFAMSQQTNAEFLNLPSQWLAIAVLPIIIAMFVGGYIKSFKGFGVELEAALRAPVSMVDIKAADAVADIQGDVKRSMSYLHEMSEEKAQSIRSLQFVAGRKGYYESSTVTRYLDRLSNVDFLLVLEENGTFVTLLPTDVLYAEGRGEKIRDEGNLTRLIDAIEANDVVGAFRGAAITLRLSSEQPLVSVLRAMRSELVEYAPVVSPENRYLGVVYARDVERRIADSVLTANKSSMTA